MNKEEIIKKVRDLLLQSQQGMEVESPKIDFKKEWYNLKDKAGLNEFVKDTTSIANTVGLDGFIIIGWDDKSKCNFDTTFSDSNLKDSNEIQGIIAKKCSDIFDLNIYDLEINSCKLSIIHIPPYFSKPVLIKNYQTFDKYGNIKKEIQQCIWVRKGTTARKASKYDLDLMYYDRKNVIQEEKLNMYCLSMIDLNAVLIGFQVVLQNFGTRPVTVSGFMIEVDYADSNLEKLGTFLPPRKIYTIEKGKCIDLGIESITINPNESIERVFTIDNRFEGKRIEKSIVEKLFSLNLIVYTVRGKNFKTNLNYGKFIKLSYPQFVKPKRRN